MAGISPGLQVVHRPIESLIPYARNSRTHSDAQVAQIAASIREFGWTNPVLLDGASGIIAGHGRVLAAREMGETEVPCIELAHLTEAQRRAYVIADNKLALNSGWDDGLLAIELEAIGADGFDLGLIGFSPDEMARMRGLPGGQSSGAGSLAAAFMVAPFSVLNAREGWWQERKRAWLALGIRSEIGRGGDGGGTPPHPQTVTQNADGTLNYNGTAGQGERFDRQRQGRMRGEHVVGGRKANAATGGAPEPMARGYEAGRYVGSADRASPGGSARPAADYSRRERGNGAGRADPGLTYGAGHKAEGEIDETSGKNIAAGSGTSIFDPVLCEIAYRWFSPPAGVVLDPFAGGSVRGIVAAKLGRSYLGIDLSGRQIAANWQQAETICGPGDPPPAWIEGDSREIAGLAPGAEADLIFSCPPYADLEVYSDDPRDLSRMPHAEFFAAYRAIVAAACAQLRPDRFACFVVGEVRDRSGHYIDFVGETVQAFRDAGLAFYNEAILITAAGSLPIRAGKQFSASRKLGKTHQNILVFLKGNAKRAVAACGPVEVDPALLEIDGDDAQPAGPDLAAEYGDVMP